MVKITRNPDGYYKMVIDDQVIETTYETIVDASKDYEKILKEKEKEDHEQYAAFSKKFMGICKSIS